jgi:hypothetical protein
MSVSLNGMPNATSDASTTKVTTQRGHARSGRMQSLAGYARKGQGQGIHGQPTTRHLQTPIAHYCLPIGHAIAVAAIRASAHVYTYWWCLFLGLIVPPLPQRSLSHFSVGVPYRLGSHRSYSCAPRGASVGFRCAWSGKMPPTHPLSSRGKRKATRCPSQ